jgi:hypothetical protein
MHWHYAKYVFRHKLFVLLACLRLRVPLHQAILHDWSKFLPDEWLPYARFFYGVPVKQGGIVHRHRRLRFDVAWLRHQHRSPHHYQHWVLRNDDGSTVPLPMPERFAREMVADWMGAGRALGKPDTAGWYRHNRARIVLHPDTRALVEGLLGVEPIEVEHSRRAMAGLGPATSARPGPADTPARMSSGRHG